MSELDDLARAASSGPARRIRIPGYPAIVSGARLLDMFGWFALVIGLSALCIGAAIGTIALRGMPKAPRGEKLHAFLGPFVYGFLTGIWFLIGGVFLRMQGALAIAVRDIAMNSFRR